jgi:hypothetical protein
MAGRFSPKPRAAAAHTTVVEPSTGKMPSTIPKARLKAIFCRVMGKKGEDGCNDSAMKEPAFHDCL